MMVWVVEGMLSRPRPYNGSSCFGFVGGAPTVDDRNLDMTRYILCYPNS